MFSERVDKRMVNRYEQVRFFSDAEFLRRQNAVIGKMKEHGVDLLLIADPKLEGFAVWLAYDMTCDYVMLDTEGTVTVVYGHEFGRGRCFTVHSEQRVRMKPIEETIPNVKYVSGLDIDYIVSKVGGSKRMGIINRHALRKNFYDELFSAAGELELVDMRNDLTLIRVVRSEEEKEAIELTGKAQKKLMDAVPMLMREGRYMKDVVLDLQHYAIDFGCNRDEILIFNMRTGIENDGSELPKYLPLFNPVDYSAPIKIQKGYTTQVMLESNSYGGLMLDTGRPFFFGDPHPLTVKMWEAARKIQTLAIDMMRPGMTCRKLYDVCSAYADSLGVELEFGNWCHGLGNSRTEGPDLRDATNCDYPFVENMHLLCEPNVLYKIKEDMPKSVVLIPDSFFVSKNGGVPTTDISHDIFVID